MDIDYSLKDFLLVLPLLVLFLASLAPITFKVLRGNKESAPLATILWGLMGVVGAAIICLSMANRFVESEQVFAFSNALVFDGTSTLSSLLILAVLGVTLIYSKDNLSTCSDQFSEFVFLLVNAAIGMLIVAWSNDLVVTFIGIEIMSLCLYILIALSNEGTLSKEAAFKYFVLGSFASAIFLYGVAFIYGTTGGVYISEISKVAPELMSSNRLFLMGIVLTALGFCFKVSIAPFHAWTPDVYEGAPTPVTGFMATGVKVVTFVAFLRFIVMGALQAEASDAFMIALQWLAVATILVGNIAAVMQSSFKRMLAYSSVAHSGYIMIALIAAGLGGDQILGASGVMYYVLAYSVMTIGAFGVASLFESRYDKMLSIEDLRGLGSKKPWTAGCISLLMLSLAGIPPTIGFFGKFYIFAAAYRQGLLWLAIWGVIGSVISVYYYLRPIVVMYMKEPVELEMLPKSRLTQLMVSISAILVVIGAFAVEPIYTYIFNSVGQLY